MERKLPRQRQKRDDSLKGKITSPFGYILSSSSSPGACTRLTVLCVSVDHWRLLGPLLVVVIIQNWTRESRDFLFINSRSLRIFAEIRETVINRVLEKRGSFFLRQCSTLKYKHVHWLRIRIQFIHPTNDNPTNEMKRNIGTNNNHNPKKHHQPRTHLLPMTTTKEKTKRRGTFV